MQEHLINLIKNLSECKGVSGFEAEVQKMLIANCAKSMRHKTDALGNLFFFPKHYDLSKPTILLEAHADEVGFIVKTIHESGLLGIVPIGSIIDEIVYGSSVQVRVKTGEYIRGVFTFIDPHFAKETNTSNTKWIDIGATSKREAEDLFQVEIGQPVVPFQTFDYSETTDIMHGKAFDNRLGCAVLEKVLDEIQVDGTVNVVGLISVQEEVGSRGISFAMKRVKADLAVCLEGCPTNDAVVGINPDTYIGRGPMVRFMDRSMICKPELMNWVREVARNKGIPVQFAVRGSGGTDAAIINNNFGTPSVVVGIPVRHVHSFHSISTFRDVQATQQLCKSLVASLDQEKCMHLREAFL